MERSLSVVEVVDHPEVVTAGDSKVVPYKYLVQLRGLLRHQAGAQIPWLFAAHLANGCPTLWLTPELETILSVAPPWHANYFNAAIFASALQKEGARIATLHPEEYAHLLELQVTTFLTLSAATATAAAS